MNKFSVICHTENCENAEIPIEIEVEETDPIVICGVCSVQISDITPVVTKAKK